MQLRIQKRLAGQMLKCSEKRVWLDQSRLEDIKESITKADIRSLIIDNAIKEKPMKGISKFRARKTAIQKRKGRRKGTGSQKGVRTSRLPKKLEWMHKIRLQRKFLKELRDKQIVSSHIYQELYNKAKSGFFRSKRHVKQYLDENKLVSKKE